MEEREEDSDDLMSSVPPPQAETGTKIFAMRRTEDAELLKVWHERIIPSLPNLLVKTIGDSYSVSLIRKGISELSGTAVIQIQSHTVPSKTVRALIRNQIVRWVNKDISLRSNQVQFLKERPEQSYHGSDDDAEFRRYPFYKRYWGTPGMGASIGLLSEPLEPPQQAFVMPPGTPPDPGEPAPEIEIEYC
jgi:hypothetical protein